MTTSYLCVSLLYVQREFDGSEFQVTEKVSFHFSKLRALVSFFKCQLNALKKGLESLSMPAILVPKKMNYIITSEDILVDVLVKTRPLTRKQINL